MSSTDERSSTDGVPSPGDPDRKRVLNVLAQRRYRQRRREKIAALEARAQASSSTAPEPHSFPTPGVTPSDAENLQNSSDATQIDPNFPSGSIVELSDDAMGAATSAEFGFDFSQPMFDTPSFTDLDLSFPSSLPPSPPSITVLGPAAPSPQPNPTTLQFPLTPDPHSLPIPILSTLRATLTIASLLSIQSTLYDLSYTHTSPPSPHLPPHLQPTPVQLTIPHHPILDIFPWPSVRTKLILMLASGAPLPVLAGAGDSPHHGGEGQSMGLAIMQLVSDVDDLAEGVRVSGNELEEGSWEVGETVVRNWWWAFDGGIIAHSNRLRARRGQGRLRLGGVGG